MNLKDIIYGVYGRDITSNLMEISGKTQDVEITRIYRKTCYLPWKPWL